MTDSHPLERKFPIVTKDLFTLSFKEGIFFEKVLYSQLLTTCKNDPLNLPNRYHTSSQN